MHWTAPQSLLLVLAAAMAASAQETAPPKPLVLEVAIADTAEGGGIPTAARLKELETSGKLRSIARYRLTLLDEQPATVQFKEQVPMVTGNPSRGSFGSGGVQLTYSQVNIGTVIQATARRTADDSYLVKLAVERSAITGEPAKAGDGGQPPAPPLPQGISTVSVQTTVHLKPGEPLVMSGRQVQTPGETSQTWIVVTALVPVREAPAAPASGARRELGGPASALRIVRLRNASAPDLAAVLQEVLAPLPGVPGQRLTLPPAVVADPRTNSLILAGPPSQLDGARALVERLDSR